MEFLSALFWGAYFVSLYLVIFWLLVYLEKGTKDPQKNKLQRYPFVSIVIPAHNEEKNIVSTIASALQLDYPKHKMEILVVENGSTDATAQRTKEFIQHHSDYTIHLLTSSIGKGVALNHALHYARGEFFICLDADSCVQPDALKNMLPYFENKDVAIVLPTIKVEKPTTFVQKLQWFEYTVTFFLKKMMAHLDVAYVAPGPFSVYRKNYLQKVGGFDEHNLTEDMEIAFRMQKVGYKIIQLMQTVVYTKTPLNIRGLFRQRNRWYKGGLHNLFKYRSMLFKKEYGEFGILQMPLMWTAVLLSTLVFVFIYYKSILKPLWNNFYHLSVVDFDIVISFSNFFHNLTLYILGLDYVTLFFLYFAFALGFIYVYTAFQSNKEKMLKEKIGIPIFYFLFFAVVVLFIWIGVLVDLVRGKIQQW